MENITGPWDGRCKGLILPIFPWEYEWDSNFRAFLYLVGMLWCFIGISVLSDSFMSGIDTITNSTYRKRVARRTPEGEVVFDEQDIPIWNPAVANLTLMALGSSTPEILLALIELLGRDFFSGDLGPGTVLGSASFNLYIITGLCMLVIPENEIRKVKGVSVFLLTSFHSLFAYIWLYIVLVVNTKDVIDLWEAVVTLALMPFLVALVYLADRHASSSQVLPESEDGGANHDPSQLEHDGKQDDAGSAMEVTPQEEEGIEAEGPRLREFNKSRAIEAITHAKQSATKMSYLAHRRAAMKMMSAQKQDYRHLSHYVATRKSSTIVPLEEDGDGDSSTVMWEATKYTFPRSVREAQVNVERRGNLDAIAHVDFYTEDGTVKADEAYKSSRGTITFHQGQSSKAVIIPVIPSFDWNKASYFTVKLKPSEDSPTRIHPQAASAIVCVSDELAGPEFTWNSKEVSFPNTDSRAILFIQRHRSFADTSTVRVVTEDGSAVSGKHYKQMELKLDFLPHESLKQIKVRLLPSMEPRSLFFTVKLYEEHEGVQVSESSEIRVKLESDLQYRGKATEGEEGEEEEVSWSQQFVQALNVNGGDESYDPGLLECVMHFLSIGWKLLAACIPPGRIWGGWACFWVALSMIGLVTALVGDMATVFGCLVGLHDAITAITIVALGTSLPDTFASMIAIRMDSTADNALGNVTGSNSVNVFLGLGLPWVIAAIKWKVSGPTAQWHSLYGSTWDLYEQYSTSGAFVVQSGALGFNVLIFSILTAAAFVIIAIRRLTLGTELGGPRWLSRLCASVFFSLWVIYIVVCSLQVYHPNDFINL
mmetsp:Transcript_15534/g.52058  ORF Transcript_15534/g.52058 Transcript_15534/m.52058 type:complete len:822 (-) Transcript_15534:135-2600(-)